MLFTVKGIIPIYKDNNIRIFTYFSDVWQAIPYPGWASCSTFASEKYDEIGRNAYHYYWFVLIQ